MKKTRFLALTLVVAIMLMGAGYAFWMEEIVFDTTVNTGKLDIKFTRDSSFIQGGNYVTDNQTGHYVGGSAKVNSNDKQLDVALNNMHPGSYAKFEFWMKNTGTIDLYVTDFVYEGDNENLEQLAVLDEEFNVIVDENNNPVSVKEYLAEINDIAIVKGEKGNMEITFGILKCANDENFEESQSFKFSIKANVRQYNDDRSCDEKENPTQEITGFSFNGKKVRYSGKTYVKGTLTVVFRDNTTRTVAINEIVQSNNQVTKEYEGYELTFKINQGNDMVNFSYKKIVTPI